MVAQLNSSLLIAAVIALIIPAAFHLYLEDKLRPGTEVGILLQMSRGSAIILILMFVCLLSLALMCADSMLTALFSTDTSPTWSSNSTRTITCSWIPCSHMRRPAIPRTVASRPR